MKHITCIEDLRQLHKRRVPKAFFDYADRGSYTEDTLRANSEDLAADQVPPAHPGRRLQARSLHHDPRRARRDAADPRAGRPARHAAWRRRDSCLPRRAGRRHSLHPEHDVDLLDRGYRSRRRQAVLVPALRDEGPRLHQGADRARDRGEMLGAGADRRSAGDRAAPPGHQERHVGAAGMVAVETARLRQQAVMGRRRAARQAPQLRQHRRPRQRHRGSHQAVGMDGVAVRHLAELEGHRLDPLDLAGQADPQRHSRRRGRRGSGQDRRAGASSSPTMAAASSTARRRRSRCCRRSSTPSARRWRSCSTAASAPARTWCARSRSAPNPA